MGSLRMCPGSGSGNNGPFPRVPSRWSAFLRIPLLVAAIGITPALAQIPAAGGSDKMPAPANRIVSLAPNLTEILLRLGASDRLVGRSSACREPASQVRDIPVAGDFGTPNLEMLARLHPDAVVTTAFSDPGQQAKLEGMGLRVHAIPTRRVSDIPRAIRFLGALSGKGAEAETAARDLETRIEKSRQTVQPRPPAVYLEIWGDPLTTAGADSFLTDVIELAGGRSIFADTPGDYFVVSPEAVAARNPDVMVFLQPMESAHALRIARSRPGWNRLGAVRGERVRTLPHPDDVQQPGWNVMEGVEQLRSCLKDAEAERP